MRSLKNYEDKLEEAKEDRIKQVTYQEQLEKTIEELKAEVYDKQK